MYNLGVDNYGWAPAFADYKQILEQLKSGDEMLIYEAMINLSNQLSMAQENTLASFPLDQYIPALIDILKRPPITDLANEINMFVIQCLTNLMDIFPTVCGTIVNHGAVKCIAEVLERSMGFIDLNDACIKSLEKISAENPYAILTSGSLGLCLNMMDFFEISTQRRILSLLLNVSRHSATEQDLNDYMLPLLPFLCSLLQTRGDYAQGKIESIVHITLRICESIMRFVSPLTAFDKVTQCYEKIGDTGIFFGILQQLQDYCIIDEQMELSQGSNQIQQQVQRSLSNASVQYILKILAMSCRYSINLTKVIIGYDIFKLVEKFLPSREDFKKIHFTQDKFPFVMETISLLDSLFPDREESIQGENDKFRLLIEKDKRALYMGQENSKILFVAEKLLPKIFYVYENNMQSAVRIKALQIIDKMISLFNDELLNNFIEPYSIAKFINSNLRANNLSSIQICLQMIDKLMKSNPKTYTLALMREGVTSFIKKISTKEGIEKHLNISLKEDQVDLPEGMDKSEDFLAKARLAILQKGEISDKEQQIEFESTIQKYLEASRIQQLQANPQAKQQIQISKQVVALAEPLLQNYFENQSFNDQINEWYGEEFKVINMLKNLARDIVEESKSEAFNFDRTKNLLKQLAECLTSKRHIMNYEFKESGLLEALELFLTHSPKQVQMICEREKLGEEVKHSEEMQLSQMMKNSQQINKKEARSFIQRLKIFAHVVLSTFNEKKPLQELVNLCHELLSQSEHQIFENPGPQDPFGGSSTHASLYGNLFAHQYEDPNQSVNALRQLTRRIRVNLIYDPTKSFLKNQSQNPLDFNEKDLLLKPPTTQMQKAQSHHPAFQHLGPNQLSFQEEPHSKVFIKRNFLYTELQQVLISVEQCASLWLLEDFLRNKIRTSEDVKTLKTPASFYQSLKKASSSNPLASQFARQIMDRAMDRMREIMESGSTRDRIRQEGDEFAENLAQEILDTKELSDQEQIDIIRQLESQTLQMMDEFYAEQEGSGSGGQFEDVMRDDLLDGNDDGELNVEQKILEFQKTIETLRLQYRQKRQIKKDQERLEQSFIKESIQPPSTNDTEMKDQNPQLLLEKIQEFKQQEEEKKQNEEQQEQEKKKPVVGEDVEMTDEEEEEQRRMMESLEKKRLQMQQMKAHREVELSVQDNQEQLKEAINMDLDELIKAVGDDIEFEFYYNGQLVSQNQTIFEILRQSEQRQLKENNALYTGSHTYGSYYKSSEQGNIYFLIKDKRDELNIARKDSLLEFAAKRERTKSEAVEDISVSAVNQIVQQLLDKEFQVFTTNKNLLELVKKQNQETKHLEQALKILKVLNFICKNIKLLTSQGIRFIINQYSQNEEEQKDEIFSDLSLQIGVSELHQNIFHHHKLDSYILKNIQDPYTLIGGGISETLQQIFRNCPFLFPFQTRQLFFKLISFIGSIDMNRSIYFLRQFLKNKLGKLPQEDKNTAVKFQKQKVIVDRSRIMDSAFSLAKQINKRAFLEVQYKDEAGTGLGPTLEFYYLVSHELRNLELLLNGTKKSIWRAGMQDNSLFPAPISITTMKTDELQKVYEAFRLVGIMLAKAISDDKLIDLPISSIFWDLVLGKKMNIFDLEKIDNDLFKIFAELQQLANRKRDLDKQIFMDQESKSRQLNSLRTSQGARIEDLGLNFTMPGQEHIELKQNGKQIDVTLDNLQEYVDLVMHFIFHESIKVQLQSFKKGFNSIFPVDTLKPFSTQYELEDMICGVQRNDEDWTNIAKLMENVVPAHGYHSKSNEYLELLRFMSELDHESRRKFLKFVTGSPRLPNGGFSSLDPKLTVVLKKPIHPMESPDDILPSVMTCQNYIKLPSYSSYEKLKAKFEMAYNEGTNNFTLS